MTVNHETFLFLSLKLKLVSVVEESLESGEQPVDHDISVLSWQQLISQTLGLQIQSPSNWNASKILGIGSMLTMWSAQRHACH